MCLSFFVFWLVCLDVCGAQNENSTFYLREMSVPDNTTELNITACFGRSSYQLNFVDVAMPLIDAIETCKQLRRGQVESALPSWTRRWLVRNYLERTNYNNLSDYTFWMGRIRPFYHVRKWFRAKRRNVCVETQNSYLSPIHGHFEDGLCSVIRRNDSVVSFNEDIAIENCSESHPFVCYKLHNKREFHAYHGFHIPAGYDMFHGMLQIVQNVTVDYCLDSCSNISNCASVTFYNDTRECFFVKKVSHLVSHVNYTIYSAVNATHYAKGNCSFDMVNATDVPNITVANRALPDCGVAEIPTDYVPCDVPNMPQACNITTEELTGAELAEAVNELVRNLTVDRESTSKHKRRKVSALDDRNSSKGVGALGVIFLICVILFFPVSDFCVHKKRKKKKKKRKGENNQNVTNRLAIVDIEQDVE